jgi:hypothetical protein|tara:strand:+ start:252 stop:506 length:255 start_codon:yes stop_codon:yes gene_type:complete
MNTTKLLTRANQRKELMKWWLNKSRTVYTHKLEVTDCPWCKNRTMKLVEYEVDGAGIPIELTKSWVCVYKPCREYNSDAMLWRY